MRRGTQGRYVRRNTSGEAYSCFVPKPLPPDPPLQMTMEMQDLAEHANRALGRLDALSTLLPDKSLFLYFYVRKEALLSSQIEGTQSSFSDLLLHESGEAPGVPIDDVSEVSRYVGALQYGLERLRDDLPLSLRLIREIHGRLLAVGRGSDKTPGEFRRTPVWVGGTRPGNALFVAPPPEEVLGCLGALENFMRDTPSRTPVLIKAALAHVQFETIHPFLDGNGRLGRLLITFLLCAEGALTEPLLYLSLYFKRHRDLYYDLLQRVRTEGDWEAWVRFFLEGVSETAEQATCTAQRILALFERDTRRIGELGRSANSIFRVHTAMRNRVILGIPATAAQLGMSPPTVASAFKQMQDLGMVKEVTGRARDRLFVYSEYMQVLSEDTEPLPSGGGDGRTQAAVASRRGGRVSRRSRPTNVDA